MSSRGDARRPARPQPRRIAVVGAGLAGLRTVAALRDSGFGGEISVLGAEGLAPYDRPPLTGELFTRTEPAWLADEIGSNVFDLADQVDLASPARTIAPAATRKGVVRLDAGGDDEVFADVAVVACGSHAVLPPDWEAATLHTAPDAAALRERLSPGSHLICVGAGWIGSEVASAAAAAGCRVTVLEAAPAPLAGPLGRAVGGLTIPWYEAGGVELNLGARVSAVGPDHVHLADGRRLDADVVLAAVGARPSTDWLDDRLALTPRRAVATDRGGLADGARGGFQPGTVYAVGDCADRTTEHHGVVAGGHWASALHDPGLVALSILQVPLPEQDPAPYVFSQQHGHELALFGQPTPAHRVVFRGDPRAGGPWSALYVEPPRSGTEAALAAGLAVDAPRDVAALRRLLAGPRPTLDLVRAAKASLPLRDAVVA